MAGKRSRAATKGMKPTKITSKQLRARKVNIKVAQKARKKGQVSGERIVASKMSRGSAKKTLKSLGMSEKESKAMLKFVSAGSKSGKISAKSLQFGLKYQGYGKAKLIY